MFCIKRAAVPRMKRGGVSERTAGSPSSSLVFDTPLGSWNIYLPTTLLHRRPRGRWRLSLWLPVEDGTVPGRFLCRGTRSPFDFPLGWFGSRTFHLLLSALFPLNHSVCDYLIARSTDTLPLVGRLFLGRCRLTQSYTGNHWKS